MSQIEDRIRALNKEKKELLVSLDKERANKQFRCACGEMHRIKNCDVIQTHWYTSPHGCTGGDYWNAGELRIICPETNVANRILFDTGQVPYEKRNHYDHNADDQFKRMYKHLFKSITDTHGKDDDRKWKNNWYIDQHHAKFSIDIGYYAKDKK